MKFHIMRLLFLLALCQIFASRTVAQAFDYYNLEYWACTPTSCSDDAGPTQNGNVATTIVGQCYNGAGPQATASAEVVNCSAPYLLGSSAQTVRKSITVHNVVYVDDGVYASSGIYDNLGEEVWFLFAYRYCDGSGRTFQEIDQPC